MLGGNFFKAFDEDPFFSGHREHMQRMSEMFNQPFGGIPAISQQGITDGRQRAPRGEQRQSRSMALSPFGMFDQNPFSGFGGMFQNMQNMQSMMMGGMQGRMMDLQNDPNCHSFSSSSVMTYSNTGNGQPEIYQASTSRTTAPGGVREERKAVRDSRSGLERQSVGHHIRDRGHVIERSRNHNTGDREENHNYENLDEDEAEGFHREFNTHMSRHPYNNRK
ncbi:unnamed protein product [Owenia fusiformis]|uniref:Myeloid leukemia factor n=1 Tax=Owenia fusiformis TaxID=6347 RepID=A0A8S4MUJ9_OWEFU|nr:unnamed protein product [Owenia fusiformis]